MTNQVIKELKNEVRKDMFVAFIKKHLKLIALVFIAIVIIAVAFGGYIYYIKQKAIKNSVLFMQAKEKLVDENVEEALEIFDYLIKNGTNGYKMLSSLEKVSYLIAKGDIKTATKILENARKINIAKYYKDMMETIEYNIRFNNQEEDLSQLANDIKSGLKKKSSFYFFNLEVYGAILVQQTNYKDALTVFDEIISSDKVPSDVMERAKRIKGLLLGYTQ